MPISFVLFYYFESAAWPGLLITEGTMPLLPEASTLWKCPVVPLILSGAPFNKHAYLPPEGALRRAVAAIMGQGVLPETYSSGPDVGQADGEPQRVQPEGRPSLLAETCS